jgi:uncharacterized protein (TIGR00255 family)
MASSMTGFGRGEAVSDGRRFLVEIRTVNNRYSDIQVRMPRALASLEARVREAVAARVNRGKIDLYVTYEDHRPEAAKIVCDLPLAQSYAEALRSIARSIGSEESVTAAQVAKLGDVMRPEASEPAEEETWALLEEALREALRSLTAMRAAEGKKLVADILSKVKGLRALVKKVEERAPRVPEEYRAKLAARVQDLLGDNARVLFDEQRLAAEVALYADRCSVDEELVRLGSHIHQLEETLVQEALVGKKLDFLLQEMNREVNTTGSKANDLELTRTVVEMKSELEKIREQIQNLE